MTTEQPPSSEKKLKTVIWEWVQVLKTVSVEPAGILMMTSVLTSFLIYQNLMIENVCRVGRKNSEEVCKEIVNVNDTFSEEEREIQKVVAEIRVYRSVLDHTFPILFVIFTGPWSDYYGRKTPLLINLFGLTLHSAILIVLSFYTDTINPHWLNVFSSLPKSLTGGETAFSMAAYSYITDKTDKKVRTIRTGILNGACLLGVPLGFAIAGRLVAWRLSYAMCFAISGATALAGFLIVLFRVKNMTKTDRDREREMEVKEISRGVSEENDKNNCHPGPGIEKDPNPGFWSIINPKNNFYEVFALPLKKREGWDRLKLLLLIIAFIFSAAPIHGEFPVMYLFLRDRLSWNASDYGNFSTYNWFIGVTGVILSMGILSKWLKLSDPIVGFISGTSQMAGCFVYAFAATAFIMYLAPTVDMMNGTMIVIARSMMSKIVHPDEIGKLFSLVAILESLIPLAVDPLYSTIYRFTVDTFSGYFFILSAALTIPPQLIYLGFILKVKAEPKRCHTGNSNDGDTEESQRDLDLGQEDKLNGLTNYAYSTDSVNSVS